MRLFFTIAVLGVGLWLTFLITPEATRNSFLAAISFPDLSLAPVKDILSGPASTISNTAKDTKNSVIEKIIPKSPADKRADLITQLEETLEELQSLGDGGVDTSGLDIRLEGKSKSLVAQSAELVTQLKEENNKSKEGAISSLLKATSGAIESIAGTQEKQICEAE